MKVFIVTQKSGNHELLLNTCATFAVARESALKQVTNLVARMAMKCIVTHVAPTSWTIEDIIIEDNGTIISIHQYDIDIHEVNV
jgi:hypothetical protein